MATRVTVTPQQAIEHVTELIRARRDEEAIDYWQEVGPSMRDRMSVDEFFAICEAMETAATAADLTSAAEQRAAQV